MASSLITSKQWGEEMATEAQREFEADESLALTRWLEDLPREPLQEAEAT